MYTYAFSILITSLSCVYCTDKISPDLKTRLEKESGVNVLVTFDGTEDICKLPEVRTRSPLASDRSAVLSSLKTKLEYKMSTSQAGVLSLLEKQQRSSGTKFTQYWIINSILIENADIGLVESISEVPKVTSIMEEPKIQPIEINAADVTKSDSKLKPDGQPQPNLKFLGAPEAWELLGGRKGDGIRIGVMDSGALHTHEALKDSWLGKYGWFDPIHRKPEPSDDRTMVLGFITGALGLGVAPNAKWMACLRDSFSFSSIVQCAQWFVCPTLPDGSEPDCSKAPHVINNSWGYGYGSVSNESEGLPNFLMSKPVMDAMIECWHAAGIIPVFAYGNEGSKCSSGQYPTDSSRVISVGAVDADGQVVKYSSRGPALELAGGGLKPDLSAPSENYISPSAKGNDEYRILPHGGTSTVAPHVVGAIALLLNKYKDLTFDQVKKMLEQSVIKRPQKTDLYENCGNTTLDQFPNNLVGHGVLNIVSLLNKEPPAL